MIIKNRAFLNEDGTIPEKLLSNCIEEHMQQVQRLKRLDDYYDGRHAIKDRTFESEDLPNVKVICNHAAYIVDMVVAYVHGEPIQYNVEDKTAKEELDKYYTKIDEDSHNLELAQDIGIYGYGLELNYMSDDEQPVPKLACLSPLNSFLVVDDTVEHKPMFSVEYNEDRDVDGLLKGYKITVRTDKWIYDYYSESLLATAPNLIDSEDNVFGQVPVIEYKNNKREIGDFEPVISLIDAYNLVQSDRVNDKEQFVDSFLVLINQILGDNDEERIDTIRTLKKEKIIELDENGDAKWLSKVLTESDVEVLKTSLKADIHEFSKVPDMTDQNFVGNSSGVAMKYKLLGLEQKGNTKERYFKQGLRKRFQLLDNINYIKGKNTKFEECDIVMKRSLPVDEESNARVAQSTADLLSRRTRIARYDAEIDVDNEIEQIDEDNQAAIKKAQQTMMGSAYEFGGKEDEEGSNGLGSSTNGRGKGNGSDRDAEKSVGNVKGRAGQDSKGKRGVKETKPIFTGAK